MSSEESSIKGLHSSSNILCAFEVVIRTVINVSLNSLGSVDGILKILLGLLLVISILTHLGYEVLSTVDGCTKKLVGSLCILLLLLNGLHGSEVSLAYCINI